jgi:hypothetical protein
VAGHFRDPDEPVRRPEDPRELVAMTGRAPKPPYKSVLPSAEARALLRDPTLMDVQVRVGAGHTCPCVCDCTCK